MPKDKDCQHVPDPQSIQYVYHNHNDGTVVVDFTCEDCRATGSTTIHFKDIDWE